MSKKSNHYLSGKELYYEIIVSKGKGYLTPQAQKMFILLAKNVHKKMWYADPQLSEDCLSTAYEWLFDPKRWMSFNEDVSNNTFAYYTEICKRALAKGYNTYKKGKGATERTVIFSIDRINQGDGMINI